MPGPLKRADADPVPNGRIGSAQARFNLLKQEQSRRKQAMGYASIEPELLVRQAPSPVTPMPTQVRSTGGGYFYAVDDWARLDRFLLWGTEEGTYAAGGMRPTL